MSNEKTVKVWDILVRLFHWSLVVCFIIAYITSEEGNDWHIYSGYAVLGLILFRVVWGFIGTKHARFSDFVYPPAEVIDYLKGLLENRPKYYLGHNPIGGWMIIALLVSLFVVSLSGLKVYAIEEGQGPFADTGIDISVVKNAYAESEDDEDENEEEEFWEEIHEASVNFTLILIFIHVVGVFVAGRIHHENLVLAMITGKKPVK